MCSSWISLSALVYLTHWRETGLGVIVTNLCIGKITENRPKKNIYIQINVWFSSFCRSNIWYDLFYTIISYIFLKIIQLIWYVWFWFCTSKSLLERHQGISPYFLYIKPKILEFGYQNYSRKNLFKSRNFNNIFFINEVNLSIRSHEWGRVSKLAKVNKRYKE